MCKFFGAFLKLVELKSILMELLEMLLVLQLVKVFSGVTIGNTWITFLLSWVYIMLFMLKSWMSFLLLHMLGWRILKNFDWSVTLLCSIKLLVQLIILWILREDSMHVHICATKDFRATHVFMEHNNYDNRLVNLGVKNRIEFVWYSILLDSTKLNFFILDFNSLYFIYKKFVLFSSAWCASTLFVICSSCFFNITFLCNDKLLVNFEISI